MIGYFIQLQPKHFFILPNQEEIKSRLVTMVIGLVPQTGYNFNPFMPAVGLINTSVSVCCGSNSAIYFIHKVELTYFAGYCVLRKGGILTFIFQCITLFYKSIARKLSRLSHYFFCIRKGKKF